MRPLTEKTVKPSGNTILGFQYERNRENHILSIIDLKEKRTGSLLFDADNDNDLDFIETGYDTDVRAYIYISNASLTKNNTQPNASTSSFSSTYLNNVLKLGWGNGSDVETNTSGLYYNLMVGNSTKNHTVVSGIYGGSSNPTAGYFGNMMQRKNISLNLQLESNATYYWYVQTIDTGLAKSSWSVAQSFTTSLDVSKPNVTIENPSPNASLYTTNPIFIFNVTIADINLTNVTLYSDFNGTLIANETNSSGINGVYVFNKTLDTDGVYNWYIKACDGDNNCNSSGTRIFYLDRGYPVVSLISPANASTSTSASITFSYNVSDVDITSCILIIDNSVDQTDTSITEDTTVSAGQTMTVTTGGTLRMSEAGGNPAIGLVVATAAATTPKIPKPKNLLLSMMPKYWQCYYCILHRRLSLVVAEAVVAEASSHRKCMLLQEFCFHRQSHYTLIYRRLNSKNPGLVLWFLRNLMIGLQENPESMTTDKSLLMNQHIST